MLRLNARAWALSIGLVLGSLLFIATIIRVLSGEQFPGRPFHALAAVLPGFTVSYAGAFVGFVYLFVIGYGLGWLIGTVYNFVATPRRL